MSKYFIATITGFLLLLLSSTAVQAEQQLQVTLNSGSPTEVGTFSPDSFTVNQGDEVTFDVLVAEDDSYCCGVIISSADGSWTTGELLPGATQTITFEATEATLFYAQWAGTERYQAIGSILVEGNNATPAAPTGLTAEQTGAAFVDLKWQPVAGATGYSIYKDGQQYSSSSIPFFTDTDITPGASIAYSVTALNGNAESEQSQVTEITIPAADSQVTTGRISNSEFVQIEETIYPIDQLENPPQIPATMIVSGRFAGNEMLTLTFAPDQSLVYTTTPDDAGYWSITIDTETISSQIYDVTLSYASGEDTESEVLFSLDFSPPPQSAPVSPAEDEPAENQNQTLGLGMMVAGLVLFLVALILYLTQRPKSPKIVDLTIGPDGTVTTQ